MYKVYLLQSLKDKRTYVGYTSDFERRFEEHNAGRVTATRGRRPFRVVFLVKCASMTQAKAREQYWKSGAGRRKLKALFEKIS